MKIIFLHFSLFAMTFCCQQLPLICTSEYIGVDGKRRIGSNYDIDTQNNRHDLIQLLNLSQTEFDPISLKLIDIQKILQAQQYQFDTICYQNNTFETTNSNLHKKYDWIKCLSLDSQKDPNQLENFSPQKFLQNMLRCCTSDLSDKKVECLLDIYREKYPSIDDECSIYFKDIKNCNWDDVFQYFDHNRYCIQAFSKTRIFNFESCKDQESQIVDLDCYFLQVSNYFQEIKSQCNVHYPIINLAQCFQEQQYLVEHQNPIKREIFSKVYDSSRICNLLQIDEKY